MKWVKGLDCIGLTPVRDKWRQHENAFMALMVP